MRTSVVLLWLAVVSPAQAAAPAAVGELGSLIPFHKDAIAAGLMWGAGGDPKICFWMRPSEYAGTDLVDPDKGPVGALRSEFARVVYGGFSFSGVLDASSKSRIKADIPRENTQCVDLTDKAALTETGKYDVRALTPEDFELNASAFHDAGFSRGLSYNAFCSGNVTLADGRIAAPGGHDKLGNAGIAKVLLFDPIKEWWTPRVQPQVRLDWAADPTGTAFEHANALVRENVDPADPSDMKYRRWYPTAVTLPDGRVLILSGTDIDPTGGPSAAPFKKIRYATPEIYDPDRDATLALESAQKLLVMYPRSYVVQTGPGWDDWKVALLGEAQPPYPTEAELRTQFDPWHYDGKTYLLDVLGAENDAHRDTPAQNHYELVADAALSHDSGAGAQLWTLGADGMPVSQRVVLFGGFNGRGTAVSNVVESIDFSAPAPQWMSHQPLDLAVRENNAVVLPDGRVLVIGGSGGRGDGPIEYNYQLFDPSTGTMSVVARTSVPRHDHSTVALLPDGSVLAMGGNRTDLVPGDPDAGVPVGQLYRPAYFFRGARPSLDDAPDAIEYGGTFDLEVTSSESVGAVAIIRTGPVTHNWDWGNRYVRLAFQTGHDGTLSVAAPAVPGAAVPGPYLLFVVSASGVPSVGRLVWLRP
jgi:hypothetical protein